MKQLSSIGWRINKWSTRRRGHKTQQLTQKGLIELAEGHWKKSETSLKNATKHNPDPLTNYLAAAYAANEQKAFDRRNQYLHTADKHCGHAKTGIALTQATLQIKSGQDEQALATLKHILEKNPSQLRALTLLKQVCLTLSDWSQLNEVIPQLKKLGLETEGSLHQLQLDAYKNLLHDKIQWHNIPKKWQSNHTLLKMHAKKIIQAGQHDEAIRLIESGLKNQWDDTLVDLYSLAYSSQSNKQLAQAEKWLQKHPHNPALLLCLGRLNLNHQFYGKAKHYLEQAIKIKPSHAIKLQLAKVYIALDDKDAALTCLLQTD
jgi:HemY protein